MKLCREKQKAMTLYRIVKGRTENHNPLDGCQGQRDEGDSLVATYIYLSYGQLFFPARQNLLKPVRGEILMNHNLLHEKKSAKKSPKKGRFLVSHLCPTIKSSHQQVKKCQEILVFFFLSLTFGAYVQKNLSQLDYVEYKKNNVKYAMSVDKFPDWIF